MKRGGEARENYSLLAENPSERKIRRGSEPAEIPRLTRDRWCERKRALILVESPGMSVRRSSSIEEWKYRRERYYGGKKK